MTVVTTIALVTLYTSIGFLIVQAGLVFLFNRILQRSSLRVSANCAANVAVILCVRGFDPSLKQCLRSLVSQGYLNKTIVVVGDCETDPGLVAAQEILGATNANFRILINVEVLETCSLKCSNLVFACKQLGSEFDYTALVDADSNPPTIGCK